MGNSVYPSAGGGCMVSCRSYRNNPYDSAEAYIVKLNYFEEISYTRQFSDDSLINLESIIQQGNSNNYFVVGAIAPFNAPNSQGNDIYFAKLNSIGIKTTSKVYGDAGQDRGFCIIPTNDNNLLLFGSTNSTFGNGGSDGLVLKINENGDILPGFPRYYGTSADEYVYKAKPTTDGGYILVGSTSSNSGGGSDVMLLKLRPDFTQEWMVSFGTTVDDYGRNVEQTSDDGYIIVGSYNGKACVIKTDSQGKTQ